MRARLCEHELFSVRSIAFISTVVKSPDETWNKYEVLAIQGSFGSYIRGSVSSAFCRRSCSPAIGPRECTYRKTILLCSFWKNSRTCVLKAEAIFETSLFQKRDICYIRPYDSNQRPQHCQPIAHPLNYRDSTYTELFEECLCIDTCIIFNP